jgi:hypothetical protein
MLAPPTFDEFIRTLFIVHYYNKDDIKIADEFINIRPSPFSLFHPSQSDPSFLNAKLIEKL